MGKLTAVIAIIPGKIKTGWRTSSPTFCRSLLYLDALDSFGKDGLEKYGGHLLFLQYE